LVGRLAREDPPHELGVEPSRNSEVVAADCSMISSPAEANGNRAPVALSGRESHAPLEAIDRHRHRARPQPA
jgi:hypothetical protein